MTLDQKSAILIVYVLNKLQKQSGTFFLFRKGDELKRVLVVGCERPLITGVEGLLRKVEGLVLLSTPHVDVPKVIQDIKNFTPDVLIVDDTLPWSNLSNIYELLTLFTNLRIVVVNNQENKVQIYEKTETQISNTQDFFSAVEKDN